MALFKVALLFAVVASASASDWTNADPEHWSHDYPDCAGMEQSPINIMTKDTLSVPYGTIMTDWAETDTTLDNKAHTIQFSFADGQSSVIRGADFDLAQCHFHTPSENTINGLYYPLEMHCVHVDADGHLAVLGQMFVLGEENEFLAAYLEHFPEMEEDAAPTMELDIEELLVDSKSYFHWMGSLTTPPCSEGVSWNLLSTAGHVSMAQIQLFKDLLYANVGITINNRPVQALNGRVVELNMYEEDMDSMSELGVCMSECMSSRRRNLLFGGHSTPMEDMIKMCSMTCAKDSNSCVAVEM